MTYRGVGLLESDNQEIFKTAPKGDLACVRFTKFLRSAGMDRPAEIRDSRHR